MSAFQFLSPGGAMPINVPITTNAATTIVDGTDEAKYVVWFEVNGTTSGSTPNLTVDVYDGTNARYLSDDAGAVWNAVAVSAALKGQKFTLGYVIPIGSKLRVTSNDAAGKFHVHGVVIRGTN